jgi:hypothetical protein
VLHVYGWVAWVDNSVLGSARLPEMVAMVSSVSNDGGNVLIGMWVGVGGLEGSGADFVGESVLVPAISSKTSRVRRSFLGI